MWRSLHAHARSTAAPSAWCRISSVRSSAWSAGWIQRQAATVTMPAGRPATFRCPLHTSASLLVTSKRRAPASRPSTAGTASKSVDSARAAAKRIAAMKAEEEREAELEEEAQASYDATGKYRRPHVKRKGKALAERRAVLSQVEEVEAAEDMEQQLAELEKNLTPAQRREYEKLKAEALAQDEDADADADAEEDVDEDEDDSDEGEREAKSPADPATLSDRRALARREKEAAAEVLRQAELSVVPAGAPELQDPTNVVPQDQVQRVEEQLRRLDSVKTSNPSSTGSVGLGFDSIDLSRFSISSSEVFERLPPVSAGMRKIQEEARRGDSAKRHMVQRIEKVTEKTKEIVGRVLLEDAVRIAATQAHNTAATASRPSASSPSTPPSTELQLLDLRSLPSFRIHFVHYSTDLAWARIMWTLGKEGLEVRDEEQERIEQEMMQQQGRRRSKRKTTPPSSSPSLPNWFVMKKRVQATLDHSVKAVRFALGRELDLKYTPSVRFQYDDLHDVQMQKEQAEREARRQQELELQEAVRRERELRQNPEAQRALALKNGVDLDDPRASFDADTFMSDANLARDLAVDAAYDQNKTYFLPRRKIAALVEREKLKQKKWEEKKKRRDLLQKARNATLGITVPDAPAPPPETTDPAILRAHLKGELARLVRQKKPDRKENVKMIVETRAQLTQLQQVQSLARKASINPVEVLKKKRERDEMPHYPENWRKMKDQFWKTTDGRTRK
jgi:hypothetical protein